MIYLAAPYNDPCPVVIQQRMEKVYRTMADYMKHGEHVISPLFMHEVAIRHNLPQDYQYWEKYCINILSQLDEHDKLVVLMLDGWDKSTGVASEIKFAKWRGMIIEYINYLDIS